MKKKVKKIVKISTSLLIVIILIGILFGQSCSSATYSIEDVKMDKINRSKQFRNDKFNNYKPSPDWGFTRMSVCMR